MDTVFKDREGSLWGGTGDSGVVRYRSSPFITYTAQEGLADNVADTLFQGSKGYIWVGGHGLSRGPGGRFHPVASEQIGKTAVWSLAEDNSGNIWAATMNGTYIFDAA